MITKRKIWPLPPQVFLQPSDREALAAMIEADPVHAGKMTTDDFFMPRTETTVYSDDEGPAIFVNVTPTVRIRCQFSNDVARNRAVLLASFPAFALDLKKRGVAELVFDTKNPLLRRFFRQQYGFELSEEMILKV